MEKSFFDFDSGEMGYELSDNMFMDDDGDTMMKMSDNMAIDIDSGDIHFISSFGDDDED